MDQTPITVYKITSVDRRTRGGFKWELGRWYETSGRGELCGDGWLHAYEHPLLAVLHNPIHAGLDRFILWEAQAGGHIKKDGQMKLGATRMRIVKQIEPPEVTREQRIRYGILCAKCVYKEKSWRRWADKWLSGEDVSIDSASDASDAASYAADESDKSDKSYAASAADYAARAADYEALSASYASYESDAADESDAAYAAYAAEYASHASDASDVIKPIDLIKIAKHAVCEDRIKKN